MCIASSYMPYCPHIGSYTSTFVQHYQYLLRKGDNIFVRIAAKKDLLESAKAQKTDGKRVYTYRDISMSARKGILHGDFYDLTFETC